ncbi:hypothetical protein PAL_GLEAN10012561 [Pteropus alecto]|uniref:Uncharacterized protein n=1 Tax=Pteropus alecto TaxID=9402 RepID=L5K9W8_PTEAL|nr:hypothetical protein PAL_GLEAN10012561 [Pteropus alecto]
MAAAAPERTGRDARRNLGGWIAMKQDVVVRHRPPSQVPESGKTLLVQNSGCDAFAQQTDTPVWSSHKKSSPTEQVAIPRQRNDRHAEVYEQDSGKKQITKLTADSESSQPTNASPEPGGGIEDIWPRKKDPGEMPPVEICAQFLISEAL